MDAAILPGYAAAASPPGALRLAVPFRLRLGAWGVASRWPFDPLGAAGARCSRLCRLDFGRDMHRFGPPLCVGGTSYRSCGRAGRSGPGLQGLSCQAGIISGRAGMFMVSGIHGLALDACFALRITILRPNYVKQRY